MMKMKSTVASSVTSLVHSAKTLALISIVFATGCSSTGGGSNFTLDGDNIFKIESNPSGAEVFVMDEKVGETPMSIHQRDVFPSIYPREKESLYGKVILKKEGCADFTRSVSLEISSNGLSAKLDCEDGNPGTSAEVARSGETAEQRLEKIKDLLSKGLITEDEAKKTRERIINNL